MSLRAFVVISLFLNISFLKLSLKCIKYIWLQKFFSFSWFQYSFVWGATQKEWCSNNKSSEGLGPRTTCVHVCVSLRGWPISWSCVHIPYLLRPCYVQTILQLWLQPALGRQQQASAIIHSRWGGYYRFLAPLRSTIVHHVWWGWGPRFWVLSFSSPVGGIWRHALRSEWPLLLLLLVYCTPLHSTVVWLDSFLKRQRTKYGLPFVPVTYLGRDCCWSRDVLN